MDVSSQHCAYPTIPLFIYAPLSPLHTIDTAEVDAAGQCSFGIAEKKLNYYY